MSPVLFLSRENKLYFVICGTRAGDDGLTVKTLPVIRLAITSTQLVDVGLDQYFDEPGEMKNNIVALFGIPKFRVRTVSVVEDSADTGYGQLGRRLQTAPRRTTTLEVNTVHPCDDLECGYGFCDVSDAGEAFCVCNEGWLTPDDCVQGDCICSKQDCHPDCLYCHHGKKGPFDCVSCGEAKPFFQADGSCGQACGVGRYTTVNQTCDDCHESCFSCSGPTADKCVECSLVRGAPFKHNGRCVSSCPDGFWTNSLRECVACDPSCQTCTGPGSLSCTSCYPHKCAESTCPPGLKPLLEISSCRSHCSPGHYRSGNGTCAACSPVCRECSGPEATQCIDPSPSNVFTSADCAEGASLIRGLCQFACPEYTFLNEFNRCESCDLSCLRCSGPWAYQCLSCHPKLGHSTARHGGFCVSQCPVGFFRDLDQTCYNCPRQYTSCLGPGPNDGTGCAATHPYKHGGGCFDQCPAGFAPVEEDKRCARCHSSCTACTAPADPGACVSCKAGSALPVFRKDLGLCASRCPNNTYAENRVCETCDQSCIRCNGPTASDCTQCAQNLVLVKGVCTQQKSSSAELGRVTRDEAAAFEEMVALKDSIIRSAANGTLDLAAPGSAIGGLALRLPPPSAVHHEPFNRTAPVTLNETVGETHQIICSSASNLSTATGVFALSFNGETTRDLRIDSVTSQHVADALQELGTVGEVGVTLTSPTDEVAGDLVIIVQFGLSDSARPRNWGVLPLLSVNESHLSGLEPCSVARMSQFVHADGFTFAERKISLNATAEVLQAASVSLGFRDNQTEAIPALSGATAVRIALSQLAAIGDIEVFASQEAWGKETTSPGLAISWNVRVDTSLALCDLLPVLCHPSAPSRDAAI